MKTSIFSLGLIFDYLKKINKRTQRWSSIAGCGFDIIGAFLFCKHRNGIYFLTG